MEQLNKITKYLNNYHKEKLFSGIVQIAYKGKIIYRHGVGYANDDRKIPFSDESIFRFYSLTKPFTAIAIMQLYEKGLLSLTDHPSKYLQSAKGIDERITIKNLLQHTSGLNEITPEERYLSKEKFDINKLIVELTNQPLLFEPDTQSLYTNTNFIMLGLIVEKITGQKIAEYKKQNIFTPLNMKNAFYETNDCQVENRVIGYDLVKEERILSAFLNVDLYYSAGAMVGNINDISALYYCIKDKKLLKQSSWDLIFTPTPSEVGDFGLGCLVYNWHGKKTYQHTGGSNGFRNLHRYLPDDDFDIIILSNAGYGRARIEIPEYIYEQFFEGSVGKLYIPEMDKGFV